VVTLVEAVVLGVLQGLGEFLPISSSGHLIVVPWLAGWAEHSLSFDVALHLGTLAAVLGAFAKDWVRLVSAGLRGIARGTPFADPDARLLWLLALASIPGGVAGLALEHWADTVFRSPALVAFDMALLGAVLWAADTRAESATVSPVIGVRDALLIGCAQALAIVPGVSRSGATISAALFLGQKREAAARFSFLLATPITAGAALVKVPHLLRSDGAQLALVGIVVAAIFGLLSIRVLLAYVRSRNYRPFVYYRFAFALVVLAVFLVRSRLLG
jgi:undecaprenyl-diphosphatase